jgi:hypothetical protein
MSNIALNLEYYLDRKPTGQEVADAEEWQQDHPGVDLSEYVDAMIEIGAF